MRSQTIGYKRPHLRESGVLDISNISTYWRYPNEKDPGYVQKNTEFIMWAKRVFAWARKRACERIKFKGYYYSTTKRVKSLVEQKKLVLGF